jgi:membrane protease YdiL (CAAX protease family)
MSSMIYAIVHFPHRTEVLSEVSWYTGLVVLPEVMRGFIDLQHIIPGFLFLTVAGIIFGLAYQWTGALYSSMGLHAGAIVVIKLYGSLSRPTDAEPLLWGTDKLTDGWLPLVYILLLLVVFPRLPLGQPSRPAVLGPAADPAPAHSDHRKA